MEEMILLDWGSVTLFLMILMRMSGFIFISPIFSRTGVPRMVQSGFVLILTVILYAMDGGSILLPNTTLELVMMLLSEFMIGIMVTMVMNLFLMVTAVAGTAIDTQMGFSMAQVFDPSSGSQLTVSATYLNTLLLMIFFAANGHHTLIRMLMTSSELVPYGMATFSRDLYYCIWTIFSDCMILGLKLTMPILAAEMLGQVGMGVMMKAIPGINVFVINIDLKVLVGLVLYYILMPDISVFLVDVSKEMFVQMNQVLYMMGSR